MKTYNLYLRRANKLMVGLSNKVKDNPSLMCENYGQKEINSFIDKMPTFKLSFLENCNIKNILYKVSEITC